MKSKCNIKKPAKFICNLAARQGFTLIEVLISIFLLVTAVFALMTTTNMIIKENAMNKSRTTAITLAKDKIEFLKNAGYENFNDANLTAGNHTDYATIDSVVQQTATGAFYMRTWAVVNVSAIMKTINVTVTWPPTGSQKTVSLKTILSKK